MTVPSQAKYVQMHCCCQTPGHYHHHIILNAEDLSPPIWSPRRFLGCTGTYRARILIAVPVEEMGVAMTELYAIQTEGRRLAAGPKGWQGWPPSIYTLDFMPGEDHAVEQWQRFVAGEVSHLGYIPNHPLPGSWSPIYCDFIERPGLPPKQKHFLDTGEESEYAQRPATLRPIREVLGITA